MVGRRGATAVFAVPAYCGVGALAAALTGHAVIEGAASVGVLGLLYPTFYITTRLLRRRQRNVANGAISSPDG